MKKYFGEFLEVDNSPEHKAELFIERKEEILSLRQEDSDLLSTLMRILKIKDLSILSVFSGISTQVLNSVRDLRKRLSEPQRVLLQLLKEGAKTEEGKAYIEFLGLK